jgi:hypothetical protein
MPSEAVLSDELADFGVVGPKPRSTRSAATPHARDTQRRPRTSAQRLTRETVGDYQPLNPLLAVARRRDARVRYALHE